MNSREEKIIILIEEEQMNLLLYPLVPSSLY